MQSALFGLLQNKRSNFDSNQFAQNLILIPKIISYVYPLNVNHNPHLIWLFFEMLLILTRITKSKAGFLEPWNPKSTIWSGQEWPQELPWMDEWFLKFVLETEELFRYNGTYLNLEWFTKKMHNI